jgi:predicted DCC family thiol-disulfide oxidoreductase YuxK
MDVPIAYPLTIYYDASCPLCAAEMHALQAQDADRRLVLVDCSAPTFDAREGEAQGVTRAAMLRAIHARDAGGRWLTGVDVFVAAYEAAHLPSMARLWRHRRLRPLWERLYPHIAKHRQLLSRLGAQHLIRAAIGSVAARDAACRVAAAQAAGCGDTCRSERPR